MSHVAIVYHSGTGKTALLAHAVHDGAAGVLGMEVSLHPLDPTRIVAGRYEDEDLLSRLDRADAIIFGSPTYMGMVSGPFKCFADATSSRWLRQGWKDKLAGGFTTSANPSGDKQGTLLYLSILAAQHCMLWVGSDAANGIFAGEAVERAMNRLGSQMGVMSQVAPLADAAPTAGDLATAHALGRRIANRCPRQEV